MTAPLEGYRVLDLSRVLAGPHCGRMLADLGADVIKVEPPAGDLTRFSSPRVNSLATYFVQQNVGKRNVSLDFAKSEGVELVLRLAEQCDVVIENFRAGVMDRLGLGFEAISARNPRIVYASITGYGTTGPWTRRRAYAAVVGAETGLLKAQGDARGGQYANDPHSHGDLYTALETCSGILAALLQRERTGRGQWVDVSMAQTLLYVNEHLHDALWDGPTSPDQLRSFRPGDYVVAEVANGESVVVAGHPAENGTFDHFVDAMGKPELYDDPRFGSVSSRLDHLDELQAIIVDFARTVADPQAFEDIFSQHELAVGTLRSAREICETDWARERDVVVEVTDRAEGTIRVPNAPWRFSDAPEVGVHGEPRYRGEDNRAVFGDLLGLDGEALDRLEAEGVLVHRGPTGR